MNRWLALILSGTLASCSGVATGGPTTTVAPLPVASVATVPTVPQLPPSGTVPGSTSTTIPPPTTTTTVLERAAAGERMQEDLDSLVALGVREAGSDAEAQAAAFLVETLEALGVDVEVRDVPLPTGATSRNILAPLGRGGTHVLLGAHFDSKPPSPGADDNGSGTVVLLELARRLVAAPPENQLVTIAFFGAEEILVGYDGDSHHFGARLLAEQMADRGGLPDLMISVDMVGVGAQIVVVTYLDADPTAGELMLHAAAGLGLSVELVQRGDISDHEAFARLGVPSAFLWRPENPDYHLASDVQVRTEALLEDLAILEAFLELAAES